VAMWSVSPSDRSVDRAVTDILLSAGATDIIGCDLCGPSTVGTMTSTSSAGATRSARTRAD
jgi:hypothetical protein